MRRIFSSTLALAGCAILLAGCGYSDAQPAPAAPPGNGGSASGEYAPSQYAPSPPPPMQVEIVPPAPGPMAYWSPGHWAWNGTTYVWVGGVYINRPTAQAVFVPGHYAQTPRGWVWINGQWQ
jgi:hypothetical protein